MISQNPVEKKKKKENGEEGRKGVHPNRNGFVKALQAGKKVIFPKEKLPLCGLPV